MRRSVSPAIATASARSAAGSVRTFPAAASSVCPRRSTLSSICSAARRAPIPSVLGISTFNTHVHDVMKRPRHLDPPKYLTRSPPVPKAEPVAKPEPPAEEPDRLDPTRYGDWEKKGIARAGRGAGKHEVTQP